jgi:hypothetical protein
METATKPKTRREYLAYIAARIASERPNETIILNELIEADKGGCRRGYDKRTADARKFKEAQETRRKSSLNSIKDHISDLCSKATISINEKQD